MHKPLTRLGHAMQQRRLADQEQYLRWWGRRGQVAANAARRAGRTATKATGNVGKTTAAGMAAGATPRSAARAAWQARKTGRTSRMQRARGLAVGALGAALAYTGRAEANGARVAGKAAARRARRAWRQARRASRNYARRTVWAATGNGAALAAYKTRVARAKQLRQSIIDARRAARAAKKNTGQPAQPAQPAQPVPTSPPVYTQPVQPPPVRQPARTPAPVGGQHIGGTYMTRQFGPYHQAIDLSAAMYHWSCGDGPGALFALREALPGMGHSAGWLTHGWRNLFENVRQDLRQHVDASHRARQDDVVKAHANAEAIVKALRPALDRVHKEAVARLQMSHGHLANVPTTNRGLFNPHFQPWSQAEEYGKRLAAWRPGSREGDKFVYGDAIPGMRAATWLVANGVLNMAKNVNEDLRGGIDPALAAALTDLYKHYARAGDSTNDLHANWLRVTTDDMLRVEQDRRGVANVPVGR